VPASLFGGAFSGGFPFQGKLFGLLAGFLKRVRFLPGRFAGHNFIFEELANAARSSDRAQNWRRDAGNSYD
jgi:hypothetical protein